MIPALLNQFVTLHRTESWQDRASDEDIALYYNDLLRKGRIIPVLHDEALLGFVEYTRVNMSQLGYILLSRTIDRNLYDPKGIAIYVTDINIRPEFRGKGMIEYFRDELERRNPECTYFVGERQGRKRFKQFVVIKRGKNGKI